MKNFFILLQELPPNLDEIIDRLKRKLGGKMKSPNFSGDGEKMPPIFSKTVIVILLILLAAFIFLFDMFYIVAPAERGIEQRFGKYLRVTGPGPHVKLPSLFDKVTKINTEEILAISFDEKHRSNNNQTVMLTSDENIIEIKFVVQYRISDPEQYLFNVGAPRFILSEALESAMRMAVGQSKMDDIIQQPAEVGLRAKEELQDLLNHYQIGLEVISLNVQDVKPPSQVKEAYDDAVKAREDLQRQINEAQAYSNDILPRARGKAARLIEEAKAYRQQVIANSEGEANRFEAILKAYQKSPKATKIRLQIEALEQIYSKNDKVLLNGEKGNNHLLLPLDGIIGSQYRSKHSFDQPSSSLSDSQESSNSDVSNDFKDKSIINLRDRIRIRR